MAAELAALLLLLLFSILPLSSSSFFHFCSSPGESPPMLCQHRATALLKHANQRKKSRTKKNASFQSLAPPSFSLNYLLRRGLVQRHGASAAAARGQSGQVRAPRSPRQGGHEVPGHIAVAKEKKTRATRRRESFSFSFLLSISALGANKKFPSRSQHRKLISRTRFRAGGFHCPCGPASEEAPPRHRCQRPQTQTFSAG